MANRGVPLPNKRRIEYYDNLKAAFSQFYHDHEEILSYTKSKTSFLKRVSEDSDLIFKHKLSFPWLKKTFMSNAANSSKQTSLDALEGIIHFYLNPVNYENDLTIDYYRRQAKSLIGAKIIDSAFIKSIKEGKVYNAFQFYTSSEDLNSQWFGVLRKYAVDRKCYLQLEQDVLLSFKKKRSKKITAIVQGEGGTGKSILLRQLATRLCASNLVVVWVDDSGFLSFAKHDLFVLSKNAQVNYLVIVEDWYRITSDYVDQAQWFISELKSLENVRVVIGNRYSNSHLYESQIHDFNSIRTLDFAENKYIVGQILKVQKNWIDSAEVIFSDDSHYASPLFLLLFTLARASSDSYKIDIIDKEPLSIFRAIISSDFKRLYKSSPAMVKALVVWASIYTTIKTNLSYKLFLQIARYFDASEQHVHHFENINADSVAHQIVRSYVSVRSERVFKKDDIKDYIFFNHDTLAEFGISKLNPELTHIQFDDIVLKDILNHVLVVSEEHFSVSNLMRYLIQRNTLFKDTDEIVHYVNKLWNNGNYLTGYLNSLKSISLSENKAKKLLYMFMKEEVYPIILWQSVINKYAKIGEKLLETSDHTSHPILLVSALNSNLDKEIKSAFCEKILGYKHFYNLDYHLLTVIFNNNLNKRLNIEKAHEVLTLKNPLSLPKETLCRVLTIANDRSIYSPLCELILSDLENHHYQIVSVAISKIKNDNLTKSISRRILTQKDFYYNFEPQVIAALLAKCPDEDVLQDAYRLIIENFLFKKNSYQITSKAIKNYEKDIVFLDQKIDLILKRENLLEEHQQLITAAFTRCGDTVLLEAASDGIVRQVYQNNELIVKCYQYLHLALKHASLEGYVERIIDLILLNPHKYAKFLSLVGFALSNSASDELKRSAALKLLDGEVMPPSLVRIVLEQFLQDEKIPEQVLKLVLSAIKNYKKKDKKRTDYYAYYRIMSLPFFEIPQWNIEFLKIHNNWKHLHRHCVFSILKACENKPEKVLKLCDEILNNCSREITKSITFFSGKILSAPHVLLAFEHPDRALDAVKLKAVVNLYKPESTALNKLNNEQLIHLIEEINVSGKPPHIDKRGVKA